MSVRHLNPDGVAPIENVSLISIATGSKIVFFAGQVENFPDGTPAGDDLRAQASQAFRNLQLLTEAAGVTSADIAKLTIYIKDYSTERFDELVAGFTDYLEQGGTLAAATATTLVGVGALFEPWCLVEIDAIAVAS